MDLVHMILCIKQKSQSKLTTAIPVTKSNNQILYCKNTAAILIVSINPLAI